MLTVVEVWDDTLGKTSSLIRQLELSQVFPVSFLLPQFNFHSLGLLPGCSVCFKEPALAMFEQVC